MIKVVNTKTLIRLNCRAINNGYDKSFDWHGELEDGVGLYEKVSITGNHGLDMLRWYDTGNDGILNRCRLLLRTDAGKYLDDLLLDVAECDYDALPEWDFVAIMERSFNDQPEREKLQAMTLEERRTYLGASKR